MRTEAQFPLKLQALAMFAICHLTLLAADPPTNNLDQNATGLTANVGTPLASDGMMNVYQGPPPQIVRTFALHPKEYDLSADRRILSVTLSIAPTLEQREIITKILQQKDKSLDFSHATTLQPVAYSIEILDLNDKVVARQEDSANVISASSLEGPKFFDLKNSVAADSVKTMSIRVKLTYKFRGTANEYAFVSSVAANSTKVLEKVNPKGQTPSDGDIVSRDTLARLESVLSSQIAIGLFDVRPENLQLFKDNIKSLVESWTTEKDIAIDQEKYFIYTPDFGRLEVKPEQYTLKSLQESSTSTYQEAFKSFVSRQKQIAKDKGELEKWYNSHHEEAGKNGSAEASGGFKRLMDEINGSVSGSWGFASKWDDLNSGERGRYQKLYDFLKSESNIDQQKYEAIAKAWVGENIRTGGIPKSFRVNVQNDSSTIRQRYAVFVVQKSQGIVNHTISDRFSFAAMRPRKDLDTILGDLTRLRTNLGEKDIELATAIQTLMDKRMSAHRRYVSICTTENAAAGRSFLDQAGQPISADPVYDPNGAAFLQVTPNGSTQSKRIALVTGKKVQTAWLVPASGEGQLNSKWSLYRVDPKDGDVMLHLAAGSGANCFNGFIYCLYSDK